MKKQLLKSALMAVAGIGLMVGSASAVLVTVSYTGDNIVDTLYLQDYYPQDENAPKAINYAAGYNSNDWKLSDSFTLDLDAGKKYSIIWKITNKGKMSSSNPAGFLAEIDYGGSENYFSGETWKYAIKEENKSYTDNFNSGWKWEPVKSYRYNGGNNIWTDNNNNAAVAGISEQAQWIWSEENFKKYGDQELYIRADFAPVPEPTTLLLFGSGLLGFAAIARRRRS